MTQKTTSKYKPEYDTMVYDFLLKCNDKRKTVMLARFCKVIGVTLSALQAWERKYESFRDSIVRAMTQI